MSIPMPFTEDIVGIVELSLRVMVEVLRIAEEKENLFAIFPIGTTMQDGGKRKRSVLSSMLNNLYIVMKKYNILL